MEHVLCVPLAFTAEQKAPPVGHMVYLCTCEQMQSAVQAIEGPGYEARGTFKGE